MGDSFQDGRETILVVFSTVEIGSTFIRTLHWKYHAEFQPVGVVDLQKTIDAGPNMLMALKSSFENGMLTLFDLPFGFG